MRDYLCIAVNVRNNAVSQRDEYSFNSICKVGEKYYGANDDGIFELEKAGTFAGLPIDAHFTTPTTDFGAHQGKHLRHMYFGGEAAGEMLLSITNDDNNERTRDVSFTLNRQNGARVPIGRDGTSRYFSFKVQNVDGCDFSIDSIDALPIVKIR